MNSVYDRAGEARVARVLTYFRKIDAGDPTVFDLFTDDVEMYFPKFGMARGKEDMRRFSNIMQRHLMKLEHDIASFNILIDGDQVVVEGTERGVTRDGEHWPDGVISQGRFCNVFKFQELLISRLFIYVDPDYTNADLERLAVFREVGPR